MYGLGKWVSFGVLVGLVGAAIVEKCLTAGYEADGDGIVESGIGPPILETEIQGVGLSVDLGILEQEELEGIV